MIAIVDYGVGNLFSLSSSVRSLGAEVRVTRDAADLRAADHILLPGVGAFADAMAKLCLLYTSLQNSCTIIPRRPAFGKLYIV